MSPTEQYDVTISNHRNAWALGFSEILKSKDMLYFLVLRDFKIRFKQSFLGILWVVIQPVITTLVYTLVMERGLKVTFEAPYALAFLCGLMAWNYFSKVMTNGITIVVSEAEMIKKVYFPRIILPLYQAISYFIDFLIAFIIFLCLSLYYKWPIGTNIFFLPIFMTLNMLFAMGISFWLAPINVRFRDIQIIIPLFLQILFIATPVMYPTPDSLKPSNDSIVAFLYNLNPVAGIVDGFRFCLLGQGEPFSTPFICSYILVFILFYSGFAFFNHSQNKFADVI
jgi:lipopolysaccharide transport system permease protein